MPNFPIIFTATALLLATPLHADIITDRPDFTESAAVVPLHSIQFEYGTTRTSDNGSAYSIGEWLVRWGLVDGIELRLLPPSYEINPTTSGFGDVALGLKARLIEGDTLVPSTCLIVQTSFATGVATLLEPDAQLSSKLCLGWALSETLAASCNVNWGRSGSGLARFNQWSGSLSMGVSFSDTWGGYAEVYGFMPNEKDGPTTQTLNAGLTFLTTPENQFDIRVGKTLSSSEWFVGVGQSFRI